MNITSRALFTLGVTITLMFSTVRLSPAQIPGAGAPPVLAPTEDPGCEAIGSDIALTWSPCTLAAGLFSYLETDLTIPGPLAISITRYYRSQDIAPNGQVISGPFGVGTSFDYAIYLYSTNSSPVYLVLPDGGTIAYTLQNGVLTATSTASTALYGSTIAYNANTQGWNLTLKDKTIFFFGSAGLLQKISDRFGNQIQLVRTNGTTGDITQILSINLNISGVAARYINLTYDSNHHIIAAADNSGRAIHYTYDSSGRLTSAIYPDQSQHQYSYYNASDLSYITEVQGNPQANPPLMYTTSVVYDSSNRFSALGRSDHTWYTVTQYVGPTNAISSVTLQDPRGIQNQYIYDSNHYLTQIVLDAGMADSEVISYGRTASELVQDVVDGLGHDKHIAYDSLGNAVSVTRWLINGGSSTPATTRLTYDPTFNQITSVTDPNNNVRGYALDSVGNIAQVTEAMGSLNLFTNFTYDGAGRVLTIRDGVDDTTTLSYNTSEDLIGGNDPLGRVTTLSLDSLGRVVATTDPLRNTTTYSYDAFDRLTSVTNALGGVTSYQFSDGFENLTSIQDPNGNVSSWIYDGLHRPTSFCNPRNQCVYITWDGDDNLSKAQNAHDGQSWTQFDYDGINRKIKTSFGMKGSPPTGKSSIVYGYDAADRLVSASDYTGQTLKDTVSRSYDSLNRLAQENEQIGYVTYTYDLGGRRTQMSLYGATYPVSYSWDAANRLTGITWVPPAGPVFFEASMTYDAADRRTSLAQYGTSTAPVLQTNYSYDADSEITQLTYTNPNLSTTLGNLTYQYDPDGRRTQVGGTFARALLPSVASWAYGNNNWIPSQYNGTATVNYYGGDLECTNLCNDFTFIYDERGHLASMSWGAPGNSGYITENFGYDALGRRTVDTGGGAAAFGPITFVYDGLNPIVEATGSNSSPSRYIFGGFGLDERFVRDPAATGAASYFLTDAIGSTIALADANGTVKTQYTYAPFGETSVSGAANDNPYKFAGRAQGNVGLYYFRGRYLMPKWGRFIAPDSSLGNNQFAYANNDPANLTDPLGQFVVPPSPPPEPFPAVPPPPVAIPNPTDIIPPLLQQPSGRSRHFSPVFVSQAEGGEGGGGDDEFEPESQGPPRTLEDLGARQIKEIESQAVIRSFLKGALHDSTNARREQFVQRSGGFSEANKDFDQVTRDWNLGVRNTRTPGVRTATLPNGTTVSVRPATESGTPPTIQINPIGAAQIKIRY